MTDYRNPTQIYNDTVRANLPTGMTYDRFRYKYNNHSFPSYSRALWYYNYINKFGEPLFEYFLVHETGKILTEASENLIVYSTE